MKSARQTVALTGLCFAFVGAGTWLLKSAFQFQPGTSTASVPLTNVVVSQSRSPSSLTGKEDADRTAPSISVDDREPGGNLRLDGLVLDPEERPIQSAIVTLDSAPPRLSKTEKNGTFSFERLRGRVYQVTARSGSLLAGPLSVRVDAQTEPLVLVLQPANDVQVTVLDALDRHPVSGARVALADVVGVYRETSVDGKVSLTGVGSGSRAISVAAAGYATQRQSFYVPSSGTGAELLFLLDRGADVAGIVVDENNKPIEDAKVSAMSVSQPVSRAHSETVSTSDGTWRIAGLPAGTFKFMATHPKYLLGSSAEISCDGSHSKVSVEIVLRRGERLAGKVVQRSGSPAAFASVEAQLPAEGFALPIKKRTFANWRGEFELDGLPRARLTVMAEDESATSAFEDADLTQGSVSGVKLVLDVDDELSGVVIKQRGDPVAGAQVVAVPEARAGMLQMLSLNPTRASSVTDSSGRFRLRGLKPGEYRVRASRSHSPQSALFWLPRGVTTKTGHYLKLVLPEEASLRGKVHFSDGKFPKTFGIALSGVPPTQFSNTEGSFTLQAIPPGDYTLKVVGLGFAPRTIEGISISSGQERDLGTIQLEPGSSLFGRVVNGDGSTVSGATVLAGTQVIGGTGSARSSMGAVSDGSGNFRIDGIGDDEVMVIAEHPNEGRSSAVAVSKELMQQALELRLLKTGSLEGSIRQGGTPIQNGLAIAVQRGSSAARFIVSTQSQGRYRFDKLAPGTYRIAGALPLSATGTITQAEVAIIKAAETARVDIDIQQGPVTFSADVVETNGRRVSNAVVYVIGGEVTAANGQQLEDAMAALGSGQVRIDLLPTNGPLVFSNMGFGDYSLCAMPVRGDLADSRVLQRIRENPGALPVYCQLVRIDAGVSQQSVRLRLPEQILAN